MSMPGGGVNVSRVPQGHLNSWAGGRSTALQLGHTTLSASVLSPT